MSQHTISPERQLSLKSRLHATVDSLHRRKASEIAEDVINDYVTLHWLEWWGGALRVTVTGENICRQMVLALHTG